MSTSKCCFLTCIQVSQEAGQVVWYSHLLKNFPQFIVFHAVKDFGIVNKAEIDVFSELSCCFDDPRQDQYIENCKALMKEIKDHTDRCWNIPCSWIRMINIVKMSTQHKAIYRFNAIPVKLPMLFFTELEQIASQFVWKYRKPGIAQSNLAKEEWNWRNQPTWLQALLQSYSHQNSINWLIEKAKELQKNIYFCFIDYTKPLTVWLTANWKILQEMGIPVHLTCFLFLASVWLPAFPGLWGASTGTFPSSVSIAKPPAWDGIYSPPRQRRVSISGSESHPQSLCPLR